jgi:hypothetical protein
MGHEITLGEEEISDVSLATFYVFDKENPQTSWPRIQLQLAHGGGAAAAVEVAEAVATAEVAAAVVATAAAMEAALTLQ